MFRYVLTYKRAWKLSKVFAVIILVPPYALCTVFLSWHCWSPIGEVLTPRYLKGTSFGKWGIVVCSDVFEEEILIFACQSLSSDGIPWESKIYFEVYRVHFEILSFPLVAANRCSHVCDVCYNCDRILVIWLLVQSFEYCRASSTKPSMCLVQVICLLELIIFNPLHIFWN